MKIETMGQAAKLAADCIYIAHYNKAELTFQDFEMAENIIFSVVEDGFGSFLFQQKIIGERRFRRMEAYFKKLEYLLNKCARKDYPLSDLGNAERQVRNDLQYLVCIADEAREKVMEKYEEEDFEIIKTAI